MNMFKTLNENKQKVVKEYMRERYPQYNFIHGANGSIYRGDADGSSADFIEIPVTELFDLVTEIMYNL